MKGSGINYRVQLYGPIELIDSSVDLTDRVDRLKERNSQSEADRRAQTTRLPHAATF